MNEGPPPLVVMQDDRLCKRFLLEAGVLDLLVPQAPWDAAYATFEHGGRLWMGCRFTNPHDAGFAVYGLDLAVIPLGEARTFFEELIREASVRCGTPTLIPSPDQN